jgi:hypothetical protein
VGSLPRYEIVVRGEFSDVIRAQFSDVRIQTVEGNTHLLTGELDQAGLYGLIGRIESLVMVMLSMAEVSLGDVGRPGQGPL